MKNDGKRYTGSDVLENSKNFYIIATAPNEPSLQVNISGPYSTFLVMTKCSPTEKVCFSEGSTTLFSIFRKIGFVLSKTSVTSGK